MATGPFYQKKLRRLANAGKASDESKIRNNVDVSKVALVNVFRDFQNLKQGHRPIKSAH